MIGNGIQVGVLGQGVVKGRVKYSDLGQFAAENFAYREDSFDVVWVVKRRQIDAVLDALQNFVGDDRRFGELLAAMNYTVPHRVDVAHRTNLRDARLVGSDPANHK